MQVADDDRELIQHALELPLPTMSEDVALAEWLSVIGRALAALLPSVNTDSDQMEAAELLLHVARVQELNPFRIDEDSNEPPLMTIVGKYRQSVDAKVASLSRTVFARLCDAASADDRREDAWRTEARENYRHWAPGAVFMCPPHSGSPSRKRMREEGE